MRGGLYLETASEEDLEALLALEQASYTHPWTLRNFRDALLAEGALVVVLRAPFEPGDRARGIVGYCVAQLVVDELHVHNVLVRPAERSRGLGRRLLGLVLGIAARRGARAALLEVRQGNWPALHLYRALGFAAVAVRRDYYDRPREDAVVLRKADLTALLDP